MDTTAKELLTELVSFNIKYRRENNIKINDVINLLTQASKVRCDRGKAG